MIVLIIVISVILVILSILLTGFRIVRPNERGLIEVFGKYRGIANQGLNYISPLGIGRIIKVDMTEKMTEVDKQEVITEDRLNATVDAQIYYKVKDDEKSIKNSQYNVYNYQYQIVQLARTTLRNKIGQMDLNDANVKRTEINDYLTETLSKETSNWGIEIVRAELKEISPPENVQQTMNEVVIAKNKKQSAIDYATAKATEADGLRQAKVKEAEGEKQAAILKAEGQKEAFKLINESFKGNARILRQLEVTENALKNNVKFIVPQGSQLINVIGESAGLKIVPMTEVQNDQMQ